MQKYNFMLVSWHSGKAINLQVEIADPGKKLPVCSPPQKGQ